VTRCTDKGSVYSFWEKNMPRIPDCIADCAIYLYASEHDARNGEKSGGSGFLVHVPSTTNPRMGHTYAVTNKHLVDGSDEGKFWTIRLTRKGGGIDLTPTEEEQWFKHEDGDDVAIYPIGLNEGLKWWSVGTDQFLDHESIDVYKIGYGDDVFLMGRLITQAGVQKNTPVMRSGLISLMADPTEPIKYKGQDKEAFLVECRSISGFSGSPVFVMSERGYHGDDALNISELRKRKMGYKEPENRVGMVLTPVAFNLTVGPFLLGIDFGHLPLWDDVYNGNRKTSSYRALSNTGIAGVVPSWKIMDVLNTPKLQEDRESEEIELKDKLEDDPELT
jgi:hypothetical protein